MASAFYQVKMAAEVNGLDDLATKYTQLTIAEQLGDAYSQARKLGEEQAKNQEAQDEVEEWVKIQKAEDEAGDEGRLREELSLGLEEYVIS